MEITANDEPTEIEADVDKRFSSIIVNLPVQQTGTGTPSPSNPRPFTMWTDVSLYVSDTEEADDPTLSIELPTPMYGGKVDMVRGEIATTYNSKESGTGWEMTEEGQFRCQVSAYNNGDETSTDVADLYAVHYETVSNKDAYDATDDLTCGLATIAGTTYLYVNDAQYTTLESFATHIADEVFVFRAHIPMSDVTEPHIVYLPEGTSYVWADAGFVDYTVSGTPPLSLPNSLGKPLKAWSVDVLPYQEGTGDPSPTNVRPIHGTDKLTITTAGKNLLEPKFYGNVAYNQSVGGKAITTTPQDVTSQVSVNGNTYSRSGSAWDKPMSMILDVHAFVGNSLTLSGSTSEYSTGMRFGWYVTSEDYTITARSGDWTRPVSNTFNIQTGDYYIILYINSAGRADASITEPMIELGSTATPFTPYIAPSQTVITLPQTVYTGTIGSDGGESRSAVIILDGTQSINNQKYDGAENIVARWNLPTGKEAKSTSTGSLPLALCETMKPVINTMIGNFNSWTSQADFAYSYTIAAEGNRVGIALPQSLGITNNTQLNAYLAANPIKIVYDVAAPSEFAVTAPTIPTPTGTATTWATAEDGTVDSMEVTYVGKA